MQCIISNKTFCRDASAVQSTTCIIILIGTCFIGFIRSDYHILQMSGSAHKHRYKNSALDSVELRRRREEEGVQLRKQKRELQLYKRRNVNLSALPPDDSDPLQVGANKSLFNGVICVLMCFHKWVARLTIHRKF